MTTTEIDLADAPVDPLEGLGPAPLAAERTPAETRSSAWWWFRTAAICVSVLAVYEMLVVLGGFVGAVLTVFLYLVFGAVVSFLASPVVDAMERYLRIPRTVAILVTLLGGLSVIVLAIYLAASPTVTEAQQLATKVPEFIDRGGRELKQVQDQLTSHGINTSNVDLGTYARDASSRLTDLIVSGLTGTLNAIVDTFIVFVVAFWLLKDGANLRAGLLGFLPSGVRVNTEFGLDSIGVVIGGYVRAQLVLAVIIGTLAGVGCALLGVPFPIVVAISAGTFELIPIVGPFVGGAVGILLALTVSPGLALLTLFLFIGIHILEGYILAPRIQAKFVQLHPLVSLLALFAGIEVRGFLGAFFAVPVCSLVAVYLRAFVGDVRAKRPELYATHMVDTISERRRQSILGEFRLFKRSPMAIIRERLGGRPQPPTTPPSPVDAAAESPAKGTP